MDPGDLVGQLAKREAHIFPIIRQGGQIPILLETLLVDLNEVFLNHKL
jgi:hypothetical protein